MRTLPSQSFGTLLRRYRQAAGLTQEELAERAGLSRDAIETLERGIRRTPRKATLALLAEALALTAPERALLEAAVRRSGRAVSPPPAREALLQLGISAAWPLVGRARELTLLEQHLAGVGPPVLLLAGEPGIGKSRLLGEAAQHAAKRGWTVLEGGCQRRSGQEPFTPLVGALEGHLRRSSLARLRTDLEGCAWLVRLLPELAEMTLVPAPSWTLPPDQERRLMFAAIGHFLTNLAGPAGTLLVLDDLQWAGADALYLLTLLMRSPAATPLRVLGAYRSTEVRPSDPLGQVLADLAAAGLAAQQRLGPLAPEEASTLFQRLLSGEQDPGSARREQVLARTGGVPFFLVSCAEAVRGRTLTSEEEAVPWTVAQSIRQRVAALPVPAQEVLGVAAVIGRQMQRSVLVAACTVSGQETGALVGALEEVGQAHLLVETGADHYQFPHDLIREVVLADLSALRRLHAHAQIAAALEHAPGEPPVEQLAEHYCQTDDHEKARLYLERAGDRARSRYAHAAAEGSYRALLERVDRPLETARVSWKLSRVLSAQARDDEALALLEQATEGYHQAGDPAGEWRTLTQLGFEYIFLGNHQAGLARLEPWLTSIKQAGLPEVQTNFQSCLSLLYLYTWQFQEALAQSEEALSIAETQGSARGVQLARRVRAGALQGLGHIEESIQILEALVPHQKAIRDEGPLYIVFMLSLAYYLIGDFARGGAALDQGLEAAGHMDARPWKAILQAAQGHEAFVRGEWRQARQDWEQALETTGHSRRSWARFLGRVGLGQLDLAEGQHDQARPQLEKALTLWQEGGQIPALRQVESMLAEDDLLHGQAARARARVEAIRRRVGNQPSLYDAEFLPLLGWAALEVDEEEQAEGLIAAGLERARTSQHRLALVDALRIQAQLCLRQQRWAEADAALEETLLLCRAMPYPWAEAKALYVCGLLHQARGEQQMVREQMEAALAICARLGERLYAEQMEQALAGLEC
jgi:transcriptional regulator with XRE-family HTH domain/tetratricopeptide (TPR) repeat protein